MMQTRCILRNNFIVFLCLIFLPSIVFAKPHVIKHVPIYQETSRFGGWPANFGIWSWGDEILVGLLAHGDNRGKQVGDERRIAVTNRKIGQRRVNVDFAGGRHDGKVPFLMNDW